MSLVSHLDHDKLTCFYNLAAFSVVGFRSCTNSGHRHVSFCVWVNVLHKIFTVQQADTRNKDKASAQTDNITDQGHPADDET